MDGATVIYYGCAVICALSVLIAAAKRAHPIRSLLVSAFSGAGALMAVNVTGFISGVTIGLNFITAGVSLFGGVPGVIMLTVLKTLSSAV